MACRLERSGAEPWIPAQYPSLLEAVDQLLDDLPERMRPSVGDLFKTRASAHAALQRVWAREDQYVAAGYFADRARYRVEGELLFGGPSLYSRYAGSVSIDWSLEGDKRRFAEECFKDYEALVEARQDLYVGFLDLHENPPTFDFSVEAVLESADDALLAKVPVRDLFAPLGRANERRLARYLKAFDTERKVRNRRSELETLLTEAGTKAPHQGDCPGFDTALELIAARDVREFFSYWTDEPDRAEGRHTVQAYAALLRGGLHESRHISPTRYACQLMDWNRETLPVLAAWLLEDLKESSTRPWTRSDAFDAALKVLRDAPDRGAKHELRQWLAAQLIADLAQPAILALRVLPDAHRAESLPVAAGVVHLWQHEESDDMVTVCGAEPDDEIYDAINHWALLLGGEGDSSVCPTCRRSRWPHSLQRLSPTPGLDLPAHDAIAAIVDAALDQAVQDGYWSDPDRNRVIETLLNAVLDRIQQQLVAQGTSVYERALQALDELPESYLSHLRRLAASGRDVTPPVQDESAAWTIRQMTYTQQSEMAFWYQAICRHAGANPVGVPSRAVRRDRVGDLPHRKAHHDRGGSNPVTQSRGASVSGGT
jgi:hypothetical protein